MMIAVTVLYVIMVLLTLLYFHTGLHCGQSNMLPELPI